MMTLDNPQTEAINEDKKIVDSQYKDFLYGLLVKWGKLGWDEATSSPQLIVDIEDEDYVTCPYLPVGSILVGDLNTNGYFFVSKS